MQLTSHAIVSDDGKMNTTEGELSMRKTVCALLLAAFTAAPVSAKPVFLDCKMSYKSGTPRHWQVSFDEEQGTLTWSSDSGQAGKMNAIFTTETVTGVDRLSAYAKHKWTVNRVTGAATDSLIIGGNPVTNDGICKAVEPPKRKF